MKSLERERLSISLLSALFLHALIVLLLGFVDLDAERSLSQTLPPVTVRLEPVMPVQPRELPEEAPEEREAPSPEEPAPASETELPLVSDQAPAASPAPAASSQSAEQAPELSRESSSSGWTVPDPSDAARQRAAQEVEQGPRDTLSTRSSAQEMEDQPASSAIDAEEYGEEVPEQQTSSSEGSKVVYAEEPQEAQEAPSSGPRPEASRQGESSQEESIVDSRLLEELEGVESAGAGSTGTSQGRVSDGASANGSSWSPRSSFQSEQGQVDVVVGEGDEQRELLEYSLPDLTPEQLSQLPPEFEIIVEFSLQANGIPYNLALPQGSSTGYPEVDSLILGAVRNWRFNPLPSGNMRTMEGKARIVIRAR